MSSFQLEEATITSVHQAYRSGALTSAELTEQYLERIEGNDRQGPELQAIANTNPNALEQASHLDEHYAETNEFKGSLHGVPVVIKDQAETKDIVTTFGSKAFSDYQPEKDATVVQRLRDAGAIILAKTVLPDFATSWWGLSSAGGETKNPYDLDRDPGGSSSGTGAAVAANFGLVGIGEDTGGSIRVPASFCNLVGVRPTTGMISRTGLSPLVHFQDTAGPMTRTVTDAALLLDALVGYDPEDPYTAVAVNNRPSGSYADELSEGALAGARVGVIDDLFGSEDSEMKATSSVCRAALDVMASAGADVVDSVVIPDLEDYVMKTALYLMQSKYDFNGFIGDRKDATVKSFEELYEKGLYHPGLDLMEEIAGGPSQPSDDPEYYESLSAREAFQRVILNVMAELGLDAIAFPDVQLPPPLKSDVHAGRWTVLTYPTNTLVAAQASLPAISMPAGFTDAGLPVGLELVGRPFDESKLLGYAYALEQSAPPRRAPQMGGPSAA